MLAAHKINSYSKLSDEDLMERFQSDDQRAYNELVIRYRDRLVNFICAMIHDFDSAQDLAQDTLFKVYTHKHSYKRIAKFSTWLYTIAKNSTLTDIRKKNRRKTYSFSEVEAGSSSNISFEQNIANSNIISSYKKTDQFNFSRDTIMSKINELPEDFKLIIILRDIQELSYDEISRIMELAVGTVKSRLNRARLKLRDLLLGEVK